MAKYGYSMKLEGEKSAKASGRSLKISPKMSIEICNHLRGMPAERAVVLLDRVISKKEAIPLKRFNRDIGHKRNMGPGRYPIKAAREIKAVIKSAMANAQLKGLNQSDLIIKHICANKASENARYGRHRSRESKRTHVEVILTGTAIKKKKKGQIKKDAEKPKAEKMKEPQKISEKAQATKEAHKEKEIKHADAAKNNIVPKNPTPNKEAETKKKKEEIVENNPKGGGKEMNPAQKEATQKQAKAVKEAAKETKK